MVESKMEAKQEKTEDPLNDARSSESSELLCYDFLVPSFATAQSKRNFTHGHLDSKLREGVTTVITSDAIRFGCDRKIKDFLCGPKTGLLNMHFYWINEFKIDAPRLLINPKNPPSQ